MRQGVRYAAAWMLGISSMSPGPAAIAAEQAVLEEIIVTATRRQTDLQSTPISVASFSGDTLKELGIDDLRDVSQFVAGVYVGESAGAGSSPITIRGVGDNQLGLGGDSSIAIYIDGVYLGRPYANMFDLLNVERLEILKGPQGTLYGRNATGGAINIITMTPDESARAYGDLRLAEYDSRRARLGLSGPLSQRVFGGLNVSWSKRDGYVRNVVDGKDYNAEETLNVQAELRFLPSDVTEIRWRADGGYNDATLVFLPFYTITDPALFPFVPGSSVAFEDDDSNDVDVTAIDSLPPYEDRDWVGTSLTVNYDAVWGTLRSITAYRENSLAESTDADASPFDLAVYELEEDQDQLSQDLILIGEPRGRFSWVAGANYYREQTDGFQLTEIGAFGPGVFVAATGRNETEAYAVYAEGTVDITERLALIAGVRYSDETKKYRFSQTSVGLDNISPVSGEISFDATTPKVVVQYQLSDEVFLYASASNGFKSGGFSAINPVALATSSPPGHPDRFGQEDVWAYELGAKSEWLENSLRLNFSAYRYDYEDLHTNVTDAIGFAKVVSAPKAEIDGVELDAMWSVTPRLSLTASAAYVDAQYDSILTYPDGLGGTKVDDLTGNQLPRSPKSEVALGFEYSRPLLNGDVLLRVDWRFSDSTYLTELNDPIDRQRSYDTGNVRVRYTPASDKFDLEAFVDNVADEQVRSHSKPILGAVYRGMITPPRVAGVELRFRL